MNEYSFMWAWLYPRGVSRCVHKRPLLDLASDDLRQITRFVGLQAVVQVAAATELRMRWSGVANRPGMA